MIQENRERYWLGSPPLRSSSELKMKKKLHRQFGLEVPLLAWLKSYIKDRMQFTMINGKESFTFHFSCGVPHGSVLGPTLFTLLTNGLPSSIESGDTHMYVVDTTVFCTGSSQDAACHSLNCVLEELFTWCVNNCLTSHPHKSWWDYDSFQGSSHRDDACNLYWQVHHKIQGNDKASRYYFG